MKAKNPKSHSGSKKPARKAKSAGNPTVVFPEKGKVVLEDRQPPVPGIGELLIQTERTLISTGTELTMMTGDFPPGSFWDNYTRYPVLPGYCNIGTVIGLGKDVDKKWLGQRVGSWGGHARQVVVPAAECRPVLHDIPSEQAAFFTLGEIVMHGVRRSGIRWGESAVVNGLGLIGQLAVQFCHIAGARPVFGVDISPNRLGYLPEFPSIVPVNPVTTSLVEKGHRLTRERKADVVFETTGNPDLIPKQFEVLRDQGRYVVLSSPRGKTSFDFHDLCCAPSYTIIGSHNYSHPKYATPDNPWTLLRDGELFFDYLAEGALQIERLISHRSSYTEACALYEALVRDRSTAMGVILDWTA